MKNFERSEIQPLLQNAVLGALKENEVALEGAHPRRVIRSLLRLAASLLIKVAGPVPPPVFFGLCAEAYAKELKAAGVLPAQPAGSTPEAGDAN